MAEGSPGLIPMSDGVKIVHKSALDQIDFLKKQQWQITNYALVAYAAIIAAKRWHLNGIEQTLLTVIAGTFWVFSVYFVMHVQSSLTSARKRIVEINKTYFSDADRAALKLTVDDPSFWQTPEFLIGLVAVNTVSVAAAIYLIWRVLPAAS